MIDPIPGKGILEFVYCDETGDLAFDGLCPVHKSKDCLSSWTVYEDGGPRHVFRLLSKLKERALAAVTWGGSFKFLEGEPEIYSEKDGKPV